MHGVSGAEFDCLRIGLAPSDPPPSIGWSRSLRLDPLSWDTFYPTASTQRWYSRPFHSRSMAMSCLVVPLITHSCRLGSRGLSGLTCLRP